MNAIMCYYFVSQRYERDYELFIEIKNDLKHATDDAVHATAMQHSHRTDNLLEVR